MVQRNISRSEMLLKTVAAVTSCNSYLCMLTFAMWMCILPCRSLDFGGFMFAVCISVGADLLIISNVYVHSLTQTFTFKTICGALVAVFKTTTRTVTGMEKCSFSEFGGTSYKKNVLLIFRSQRFFSSFFRYVNVICSFVAILHSLLFLPFLST